MKEIYKITFSYKQDSPSGGNTRTSGWTKEIIPMDAENAEELQNKIKAFKDNDHCGYRKHIEVVDIVKL